MTYDVERIRGFFPALADGAAHFDGPGGSQTAAQVADAVTATLRAAVANRGTVTRAEQRAEEIVVEARAAMADLVGGVAGGVVFGRSMTALTFDLSRAMSRSWGPGDEVVVTRLDHDANIRPWVIAAERAGSTVRWVDFDPTTGELETDAVAAALSQRTKVVAVTGASNLLGTRPDVAAIASAAHDAGALVYVDGVHLTPHAPVDMRALGADFFACSPYKFCGPHLGAVVASPSLLETVHPDKLLPSTDVVPERFELGTLPYELLAGVTSAVDFLADLDTDAAGSRRPRIVASMTALEQHETGLLKRLTDGLAATGRVSLIGRPTHRTPTLLFSVGGIASRDVHVALAEHNVNAPAGNFYAIEASRHLGLGDAGAVRAGLAPYTNDDDVARLLAAVGAIAEGRS
ncbi:MAG TPA: cysteine desulfurase-like protein [Mycobacteriales bacterium]|nr:cysteine desulfurase-like protein [Mycobacteriales bacterium]